MTKVAFVPCYIMKHKGKRVITRKEYKVFLDSDEKGKAMGIELEDRYIKIPMDAIVQILSKGES